MFLVALGVCFIFLLPVLYQARGHSSAAPIGRDIDTRTEREGTSVTNKGKQIF